MVVRTAPSPYAWNGTEDDCVRSYVQQCFFSEYERYIPSIAHFSNKDISCKSFSFKFVFGRKEKNLRLEKFLQSISIRFILCSEFGNYMVF